MTAPPPVLGALDPDAPLPFGRDSLVRAAVAEPVTALLVQRALVMDVAHPKVAAAVADHSHFQRRPLSRAWVTVDAALRLVFGDDHTAREAARQIYGVHDHISGRLDGAAGRRPAAEEDGVEEDGTTPGVHAPMTPSLLAWVWATLVDTTETAFTRWVRPFDARRGQRPSTTRCGSFARFLGIPDDLLPADRAAFSRLPRGRDRRAATSAPPRRAGPWRARSCGSTTGSSLSPLVRVERVLALATLDPRIVDRLDLASRRRRRSARPHGSTPGCAPTTGACPDPPDRARALRPVRRPSIGLAAGARP